MNKVITINRQYGSGGREIGRKLAEIYGVPFYDNEIISRAALHTQTPPLLSMRWQMR